VKYLLQEITVSQIPYNSNAVLGCLFQNQAKAINKLYEQNAEFLNVNAHYFPLCFIDLIIKFNYVQQSNKCSWKRNGFRRHFGTA
jgi:hypothetical protein